MSKFPRQTLSKDDPIRLETQSMLFRSTGTVHVSRRRLEDMYREPRYLSASIQSSLDISRIIASRSPGTTIIEPDRRVQLPTELDAQDNLRYFGLNKIRVDQIWQLWKSINPYRFKGDFGDFARAVLGNRVGGERCDFGESGVDWSPYLRRVGVDEKLIDAIARPDPPFDGVRLT